MDEGTISGGSVVWHLDADQAPLDASLAEAQGKVDAYATAVEAANKTVAASAVTVATSTEASSAKTVAATEGMAAGVTADDEKVISRNALTIASFNGLGDTLEKNAGISKTVGVGAAVVAAGVAIAAGIMVKAAGDFQKSVTQIYSSAGETAPLQTIDNGILQIARDTGTTTQELVNGLYTISSAGFNTASGLEALRAAAEGAKAENADLATVTDALTTILHDYHLGTGDATSVTNQMIEAVSVGKQRLQDFASSLSTVLPIANQVGLSFAQVAGAEATLTAAGVSANQATQDLHSLIAALIAPTQQQTTAMLQMGLNATTVAQQLGTKGLTGTLQELFDAITAHMGPDGLVLQNAMKNATLATQDLNKEVAASPAPLRSLEQALLNGTTSFAAYRTAVRALPEGLTNLGQQFEATYNQAHSFNAQLVAGINASPTFAAQLKAMTGQTDAMNAVMLLTGQNFTTFQTNVNKVADAAKTAGNNISSWKDIQGNFNQQLSQLKEDLTTTGIAIGEALLPPLTAFAHLLEDILGPLANFVSGHKTLSAAIFLTIGAVTAALAGLVAYEILLDKVASSAGLAAAKQDIFKAATYGLAAAEWAWTAATAALDGAFVALQAVLDTLGIGELLLIISAILAALIALGIGIYNVIRHWSEFKKAIADDADHAVNAVKDIAKFFDQLWRDLEAGAKRVADFFVELWRDPQKAVHDFVSDVGAAFTHLFHDLPQWGADIVDHLKSGMTSAISRLAAIGGDILGFIKQGWDAALSATLKGAVWVASLAKSIAAAVSSTAQHISAIGTAIVDALLKAWDKELQLGRDWASALTDAISRSISRTASRLESDGRSLVASIGRGVEDAVRDAPQWGRDIVHGIEQGMLALAKYDLSSVIRWKDDLVHGYQQAFAFGRTLIEDVRAGFDAAVRDTVQWGKDIISGVGHGFTAAVRDAVQWGRDIILAVERGFKAAVKDTVQWGKDIVIDVGRGLENAKNDAVQWGRDIITSLVHGFSDSFDAIKSFFTGLPDRLKEDLHSSGQQIAAAHTAGISAYWRNETKMKTLGDDILKGIGIAVGAIIVGVVLLGVSIVVALINGIIDGSKSLAHGVAVGLSYIEGKIVGYFADAGSWLFQAGRDIVDGLAHGITSAAGDAVKAVEHVGSSTVDKLKNILGIHSPSTVFAEIGDNVVRGFAVGIDRTAGQAVAAMSGVSADVVGAASVDASPTVGAELGTSSATSIINSLSGGAAANGPGQVHVHLNMSGIVTRSRSEFRDIMKDGLKAVDEELKAKALPTILPRNMYGRSTAA